MTPTFVVRYLPHDMIGNVQFLRDGANGHCFVQLPNASDIGFGNCRCAILLALMMIDTVLGAIYVFEIVGAIVNSIFVSMVDLVIFETRANESKRNQFVNIELSSLIVLIKPEVEVIVLQAKRLVFGVMALCIAALGSNDLCNALNLPKIANNVKTLVAGDIAPFFGWGKGNLRGMLEHVVTLLTGTAKPGTSQASPGASIGFYSFIIAHRGDCYNGAASAGDKYKAAYQQLGGG